MTEQTGWLQRLRDKWKLKSIFQVVIVLCIFAIGGSLCGFLGKKIMSSSGVENNLLWGIAYILVVTLLWPLCVLLVSIPFGQFAFFKKYIAQLGQKIFRAKNKQ